MHRYHLYDCVLAEERFDCRDAATTEMNAAGRDRLPHALPTRRRARDLDLTILERRRLRSFCASSISDKQQAAS